LCNKAHKLECSSEAKEETFKTKNEKNETLLIDSKIDKKDSRESPLITLGTEIASTVKILIISGEHSSKEESYEEHSSKEDSPEEHSSKDDHILKERQEATEGISSDALTDNMLVFSGSEDDIDICVSIATVATADTAASIMSGENTTYIAADTSDTNVFENTTAENVPENITENIAENVPRRVVNHNIDYSDMSILSNKTIDVILKSDYLRNMLKSKRLRDDILSVESAGNRQGALKKLRLQKPDFDAFVNTLLVDVVRPSLS
jgi:hypothetical protein